MIIIRRKVNLEGVFKKDRVENNWKLVCSDGTKYMIDNRELMPDNVGLRYRVEGQYSPGGNRKLKILYYSQV